MRRLILALLAALLLASLSPAAASAEFGLKGLVASFGAPEEPPVPASQAGSHPGDLSTNIEVNTTISPELGEIPDDAIKDLRISLPPGFVGAPTAVPTCSSADFLQGVGGKPVCPDGTAVGITTGEVGFEGRQGFTSPVYNLDPPPGVAAQVGFIALKVPVVIDLEVEQAAPYNVVASLNNIPQAVRFYGSTVEIWGNPASEAHDSERGKCAISADSCPAGIEEEAFLTMPRACAGPLAALFRVNSWQNPGTVLPYSVPTTDDLLPPNTIGVSGCNELDFEPEIAAVPTSQSAESSSGLDFNLDMPVDGLTDPGGIAQADIKKAVVTLPVGVTANASVAEGLETCSEADLARESLGSEPGQGCPEAAKVGTVEVETPLLKGSLLKGQVYLATQNQNPFHSLLAMYVVIRERQRGVLVKLAGKIEPDPVTGQLVTTLGEAPFEIPQFPFSHFRFHFRSGARSPLVTPPTCGKYEIKAEFTPTSGAPPVTVSSPFEITSGINGATCPSGSPPFRPGFEAGAVNNTGGAYSPYYLHLTRGDGEQDLTRFSTTLPPGSLAKLVGVARCADAAIAAAKVKSGRQELGEPSCPASSQVGRVLAGAGVGSALTYASGKVYLAGPFAGNPLSVVAIVPAVAGPFDVGTVVTRQGLALNPETGEAIVDGTSAGPIPHILAGVPLKVRDVRVYVDRENFTLNPTSCDPEAFKATLWGGGSDAFSSLDDGPVSLATRFQAANCANLGFKPKLGLRLTGGTRRSGHPALKAVVTPRPGDANFSRAVVTLPHSAFLDQAHIRTICTRVQFAAGAGNGAGCPAGAVYGQARAWSPLLEEVLEGPVYLRSSSHNLPDLVVALHGIVDIELSSRIDSVRGGIRSTFADIPDAPVSKFVLRMQGGKKGLIVNSTNLCASTNRAKARLSGQNGKVDNFKPLVRATGCKKSKKAKRSSGKVGVARGSAAG